ncbi:protein ITPRID1 isoform X2 [Strigops habroptila]|uniref:protein ITPRID1 isoform X2 n=1 Tax=Strigops habroptila TaxID=2489341 RepID=UPI0011CEEF83|nr:protein ITPRID1 isoform X2 [Strigops habroptila]
MLCSTEAHPDSLSVSEMIQMTVQSYRRSLKEFSESPVMSRCKSLSSSNSLTGAPQSITEWLALWEKDPVEILLDLGFGTEEPDVCTKIPPRFLSGASVAKGINIRVFLEAQKQRMDIERRNLYERFRQLEVLDHVTSALSSLLTDINTQQTKAQDETSLLDAMKRRHVVTRAKRRRIGQLLKRASQQTLLLKQGSLAPGEANLLSRKEQLCSSADIAERGTVQAHSSARVTLSCLTQEQSLREKGALAHLTSQCPPTLSEKAWTPSHLVAKPLHLSPASEVSAKDRPRKEPPLLVAHTLKKVANLNCKLPDSFEMEEIQSFEDETLHGNAPDIALEVMVTRTSSCQSDSSGFMEELPEPAGLQNPALSGKINFISDIHNQERALSHRTVFPMLNQDFQQEPDDCVAEVFITAYESIVTVPGSMKACSNEEEETHPLLTAENGTYQARKAEPQSFVQEMLCDEDKKEEKTERKQLEKESCIEEHRPCLRGDAQDEGGPSSSKFDCHLYFSKGHKNANVTFTEMSDINSAVINESKIRGEDEFKKCWAEKDIGVACNEGAHGGSTGHVKGLCWDMEVASKDGTLLAANEVTNRQKLCKMDGDSKNTRRSPKMGVPETLQWDLASRSGSSVASLQVSQRHPSCLAEGPGLSSSEDQETGSTGEMLDANKSEQGDTLQNSEMASAPLKSVTVQMSSRLEFTPRAKGQNAPLSECLAREDPVDFSNMLARCSEGASLIRSDPGALKGRVKQTTEASSQTDIPARKPRWPPLLCSLHTHLTKSASLDSIVCGKYRSHYWSEASDSRGVQGSHCCHCCCCHGCCPWTFPMAVSPRCPVGCCSNHATAELPLLKTLVLLQDTAMNNPAPCTIPEIEVMKSSCQHFQEKLDEIEQHLTEQQALFSSAMPDEGREEARHLQLLRRAVRQEVAELEFQLRDRACQVRESILMQLDQLLAEQSHLFSELGLSDWKGEKKAWNKQMFPDAADTEHPRRACSKMVFSRAPSKTTTATGSLYALQLEAPPMQFPARTTPEPNSAKSAPQELSTSAKEIKGTPQAKMDFEAFIHNLKKSFQNSLGNDSAEGKD